MTIRKQMNFVIKQVGDEADRTLRFIGSDETPDRSDDIVTVAGWQTDNYMKNPVFLWAHDYSVPPVGKCVNLKKDTAKKQLIFDIKFPTVSELSSDIQNPSEHAKFVDTIYNLYKGGYLSATSVGFVGIKYKTRDDDSVLELPEWKRGTLYITQSLLELSAVPVPCNPNALQTAKSKGLLSETQYKTFEQIQKSMGGEELKIKAIQQLISEAIKPLNEKISTLETEKAALLLQNKSLIGKSGASISAANKEKLQAIHDNMANCMKDLKACHTNLKSFIDNPCNGDDPTGPENEPKKDDLEDVTEGAKEINLDDFDIKDFKPDDELDIDAETIKTLIAEAMKTEINNHIK